MAESEAQRRVKAVIQQRAQAEQQYQDDWESADKPTTVNGVGVVRQLGAQQLDANQLLSNTTAGAGVPIAGSAVPGGIVGDWVPRIGTPTPTKSRIVANRIKPNWIIVLANGLPVRLEPPYRDDEGALLYAYYVLDFIGAAVAGSVQIFFNQTASPTPFDKSNQVLEYAANTLGITVNYSSDLADPAYIESPFVVNTPPNQNPAIDVDIARYRASRWGAALFSRQTSSTPTRTLQSFCLAMGVATPEAMASPSLNKAVTMINTQNFEFIGDPNYTDSIGLMTRANSIEDSDLVFATKEFLSVAAPGTEVIKEKSPIFSPLISVSRIESTEIGIGVKTSFIQPEIGSVVTVELASTGVNPANWGEFDVIVYVSNSYAQHGTYEFVDSAIDSITIRGLGSVLAEYSPPGTVMPATIDAALFPRNTAAYPNRRFSWAYRGHSSFPGVRPRKVV